MYTILTFIVRCYRPKDFKMIQNIYIFCHLENINVLRILISTNYFNIDNNKKSFLCLKSAYLK